MDFVPICKLCLVKVENDQRQQILCDDTIQNLTNIVTDLFGNTVFLSHAELLALCKSCKWKLNDIQVFRKNVIKNQKRYEMKLSEHEISVPAMDEEFLVEEEVEIKPEIFPDDTSMDFESPEDTKPVLEDIQKLKILRKRVKPQTKLFKTERGCVQTAEKHEKDAEDFALIASHYELTCDLCPEMPKFNNYREVTRHYTKAHRKRWTFTCCGMKLKDRTTAVEHALAHKNPKICESCGMQFVLKKKFKKHFYACQPRYCCFFCNQMFRRKYEIKEHIQSKHVAHPKIICEICGGEFSSVGSMNAHMKRKHSEGKAVSIFEECPECGKKMQRTSLKNHINDMHKRTEPYICSQCGRSFTTRKNFNRHVRTVHVVGRKYKCTIEGCDKALLTPESLKEHIATHTGIPLYHCKYCEWSFKSAGNYYAHMRRKHPLEHAQMKQETKNKVYGVIVEGTQNVETTAKS